MAIINPNTTLRKFLPKMVAMTPYQLYLSQVQGVIDSIRKQAEGKDYIPAHMGGLSGQRAVLSDQTVIQTITFEVE